MKDKFFKILNIKIKNGKIISWKDFKKLKKFTKSEKKVDDDKLNSFQDFYKDLYSDHHYSVDSMTKAALLDDAVNIASSSTPDNATLNEPFSIEELNSAISSLKNGKASSFDMISNEIIKSLSVPAKTLLLKLFNLCLSSGTYLWSRSLITPIHKKGSYSNPDNYRAIAVCSCIGKLLSSMLLGRLIIHRKFTAPDPPNQCGFTKGCQCNDHILTLLTIIEKYKLCKKKIYAVFIDLRKAFDLVCRQALLYKLASYQVNGNFFNVIRDMYSSSSGNIKLNGKISAAFDIKKGTEQGHPLSPELFKVYFKELSDLLNDADTVNPILSDLRITHLAWADDVVILAMDRASLDRQLRIIEEYCRKWGLQINVSKTKFMVMNGRMSVNQDPESGPQINGEALHRVTNYSYLGITISSNGTFSEAIKQLSRKGLGSLFSLRNTIDRRFIDPKNHNVLFNMLIAPILTYGCQVWLPVSSLIRSITSSSSAPYDKNILSLIAKQPYEKILLRHSKYLLGINRRSCNAAAWGETGNHPLFISCVGRCIQYFQRIVSLDDNYFVKAAVKEQINRSMSWYTGIKNMIDTFDDINPADYERNTSPTLNALLIAGITSSANIITSLKRMFNDGWKDCLSKSSKLSFYKSVKNDFGWEHYLDANVVTNFYERRSVSQIRSSSHKLNIEVGRYVNTLREDRLCDFCRTNITSSDAIEPETEDHVLYHCPLGADIRTSFNNRIASAHAIHSSSLEPPVFNIAKTFPSEYLSTSEHLDLEPFQILESRNSFIRISCSHLHKIYKKTLHFKKNLQLQNRRSNVTRSSPTSS